MANLKKIAPILYIIVGLIWLTLGIVERSGTGKVAKLAGGAAFLVMGIGLSIKNKQNTD